MSQIGLTNLSKQEKFLCYSVDYTEATLNRISYRSAWLISFVPLQKLCRNDCSQVWTEVLYIRYGFCAGAKGCSMNIAESTLPAETRDLRNICANPTGWPDTF